MKKINKKNNGFTLFELLVSISIIAVLTAVAVVSFGGMNKKTRDARRISDVEKIRVALESYKQVNGSYPTAVGGTANLTGYLDKWPVGPKSVGDTYVYTWLTATTYRVCAGVELSASANGSGCSTPNGYSGYYGAVQP